MGPRRRTLPCMTGIDEAQRLLRRTVRAARAAAATARQARETVAVAHRVVLRADQVTAELEGPLRALGPSLARLAAMLDDPVVEQVPDTVRRVQDDLLPLLRTVADTHERVSYVAGQTERMMSMWDDATRGFAGLPGAALLGRRRPGPRVVTAEQTDPPRGGPGRA